MNSPAASLETVWEQREEVVYPRLFGVMSRGTFTLTHQQFAGPFGCKDIDPRWLHHGVIEFGPTPLRDSWIYVTTGTSNPWEQDPAEYSTSEVSGIGSELVLEVPRQGDWAVAVLCHMLAYNILLAQGRFGEFEPLRPGARVPLGGPINGDVRSSITFLAVVKAEHYESSFQLDSGKVDLLHLVGITESEWIHAKNIGTSQLIAMLARVGAFPVTDPARGAAI